MFKKIVNSFLLFHLFAASLFLIPSFNVIKANKASNDFYCIDNNGQVTICQNNVRPLKFDNSSMIAYARFSNRMNQTGWMELEIVTNPFVNDNHQAYYAGVLEGKITGKWINSFRKNQLRESKISQCSIFRDFIERNINSTKSKIQFNSEDSYWLNVRYILHQIAGMDDGHDQSLTINDKKIPENMPLKPHLNINPCGSILINLYDELGDFEEMMNQVRSEERADKCSAFIKFVEDKNKQTSEVFVSHNTWSSYYSMLRIMKKYVFNFQKATSKSIAFPSYPGDVYSTDDYYITSNGMVIQETTIENHNISSYKNLKPEDFIFEFIRNMVANRLADSGQTWAKIFNLQNSGSYSNQFMIVDFKRKSQKDLNDWFLTIVEQMPQEIIYADKTDHLKMQTYWASYNIPFFKKIYKLANYAEPLNKYGDLYSYNRAPRARIFARDHHKAVNISTVYALMRYNNFQNDPVSYCEDCLPIKKNAAYAIASRKDLNDPKGTYLNPSIAFRLSGALDVKITSGELVKGMQMIAESGPTHADQEPFSWDNVKGIELMDHDDIPSVFNFKPILTQWNDQQFPEYYIF